jgi:hypothetical protein
LAGEAQRLRFVRKLFVVFALLCCIGCTSQPQVRIGADPAGIPVSISVNYDRLALEPLTDTAQYQRTIVMDYGPYWYGGFHHHAHHFHGHGYGYGAYGSWYGPPRSYEPSTRLSLLIGRGPGEAQYLRAQILEGMWTWTTHILPEQMIHIAIQASGGRSGWTDIGTVPAQAGLHIQVDLTGVQAVMSTQIEP